MINIQFFNEINQERIERLLGVCQSHIGKKNIWIISPGGSFEFFSRLGPPLHRQGVTTIGIDVKSAAIILFLLGHQKLVIPESEFFFHEVRVIPSGHNEITICDLEDAMEFVEKKSETEENMKEFLLGMKNAQNWMISYISQISGISKSLFLELMQKEVTLNAKEAVYYGIAQKIVNPQTLYMEI